MRRAFPAWSASLLIGLLWAPASPSPGTGGPGAQVRRARLERDLRQLASDTLEGRRTGEPGAERAAAYIRSCFEAAGLEPAGEGDFLQPFEATVGVRLGAGNRLRLRAAGAVLEAVPGEDFLPLAFSESGTYEGPVLFAGHGITSEDPAYDDYQGIDPRGAAVVVLRHEPQEARERSPFAGRDLSHHSGLRHKALNAHRHGARALLLANDPLAHTPGEDSLLPLAEEESAGGGHLLAVHVRRDLLERLPRGVLPDLRRWQKRVDRRLRPDSRPLELAVDLSVELRRERRLIANVLGLLRGSDAQLRDQVVLVGAHYDHLGRGDSHSLDPEARGQVHNGADDNASGVSALLEMARALAERRSELRRSVLFAAFVGEEMGLLGSSHYVSRPAVPLERTVAMINLDMVGRSRAGRLYVGGAGTSPAFEPLLQRLNAPYAFALQLTRGGFGPSDHTPFYARRLPVLFFFTGAHADYHRPSDDAERIDFDSLGRVSALAADVVWALATEPDPPVFAEVEEERPPAGEGYGRRGYGAYLGTIPDFGESDDPGVTITGVRRGSPADRAGLRGGDRIVWLGELAVHNLHDLSYALRVHRPGERVRLRYVREGTERETEAVLEARR